MADLNGHSGGEKVKVDRRVQRTRKLLHESLLGLILERGYDAVTIQDITDRANLGRATFYLHYKDKEDLLLSMLESLADDLIERVGEITDDSVAQAQPVAVAFEHARENADLYRALFRAQGAFGVVERIQQFYAAAIANTLATRYAAMGKETVPGELWSRCVAGAFWGQLRWWLENDMPCSVDYMTHVFRQMNFPGIFRVLGLGVDDVEAEGLLEAPAGPF